MRPHPVLLKEYYPSEEKLDNKIDGKNIFYRIYDLFKNYLSDNQIFYFEKSAKNYKSQKNKCLFLSHLINERHIQNVDDFYYGKLPKFLEKKKYNYLIVLRNLTNQNSSYIYNQNKKFFKKKILLSKSLGLIDELRLIFSVLNTYFLLIKLKSSDKDLNNFLLNKNIFKFAGSTYNNLKLLFQVEKIIKNYKPNYFFLTYEGHAWEKLIINQIKEKFPNTKLYAYQFSIITKHSESIFLDIGKEFIPDFILTSGTYTKKIFKKKNNSNVTCLNIGSNKFVKRSKLKENSKNVLILPEGFNSETIKMMKFAVAAANNFKDKKFIFRFHPMINRTSFIKDYLQNKIKIPSNLFLSENLFEEDLKNSKYIIYRGSAASIQALAASKIVIYLRLSGEINIDPLYMLKYKIYVQKINDLKKIFKNKFIMKKNLINIKFTKEYFDKPNFDFLLKYLNK